MVDIVIGRLNNRWFSAGLLWEPCQKGAWINLLTVTVDVSYGAFGAPTSMWSFECKRLRRSLAEVLPDGGEHR